MPQGAPNQPIPRVTPLSIQEPNIAHLFQCAETLERDGTMSHLAGERYEEAIRDHFEEYKPAVAPVDTLGIDQLKRLCKKLQINVPGNFKVPQSCEDIKRKMICEGN